jgi:hypothetical protein
MTSDEEKDPPVPADVDGATPRRVRRDQIAEEHDPNGHEPPADEPNH